jgi:hypothetical protein
MNQGTTAIFFMYGLIGLIVYIWVRFVLKKPISKNFGNRLEYVLFATLIAAAILVTLIWS